MIKTNILITLLKKSMTRSQIDYILAVARLKSFSKAAESCFVTQSTLSSVVAKFEQQIGIILFDRKTKPITITENGAVVIKYLKSINREFHLLDEGVNQIKQFEAGNLSIACIPTVAPYLFPLILNSLSKSYPKVTFEIHEITTERTIEAIVEGKIDIGIVSTPLEHKDLVEYPLYHEDFLLYDCGHQNKDTAYKVSDIDLERLWLLEEGHCLRNQVGKICELRQQKKINGNLIYSCGTIFSLIEMVKLNRGITLLPRLALSNNLQIDRHHIYSLSSPIPMREIGIVTHKHFVKKRILNNLKNRIIEAVRPFLLEELEGRRVVKPF